MKPSQAIKALLAKGLTETEIATAVGSRQSTINRIKNGQMQPNYDVGAAIVLYAQTQLAPKRKRAA